MFRILPSTAIYQINQVFPKKKTQGSHYTWRQLIHGCIQYWRQTRHSKLRKSFFFATSKNNKQERFSNWSMSVYIFDHLESTLNTNISFLIWLMFSRPYYTLRFAMNYESTIQGGTNVEFPKLRLEWVHHVFYPTVCHL